MAEQETTAYSTYQPNITATARRELLGEPAWLTAITVEGHAVWLGGKLVAQQWVVCESCPPDAVIRKYGQDSDGDVSVAELIRMAGQHWAWHRDQQPVPGQPQVAP